MKRDDQDAVEATAQATVARDEAELVAVVGMGCIMPEAFDVPTFWKNITQGRSSIGEIPPERWDPALFFDADPKAEDKTYAKIGAFVTGFEFDSLTYRIPPKVAESLDGVQRMAIAATAQALKDSGYDTKEFDRTRCAVVLGQAMGGENMRPTSARIYLPRFIQSLKESPAFQTLPAEQQQNVIQEFTTGSRSHFPKITEDTMPGELANVVAGRIANVFNLSGANFTTDAACASSLAAIDMAVKGLLSGEYDMVISGGADRSMDVPTYVKFSKIGALSATGSYPFDGRADGFVMGEGAGILILKRLKDAQRDGDKIYGLIRGVGSSSDGKGKGITAPNIEGQLKCIRSAFAHAKIDPKSVRLIECHGTSTRVGDVVEVDALTKIWGETAPRHSIAIGSVKSQIGHLKSAAGAAGMIKAILALKHKTLPPSINFETPNPKIDWDQSPFYVNTTTKPWEDTPDGEPRRAAVSSFGFGGTNFHVIVEEYVPGRTTAAPTPQPTPVTRQQERSPTPVSDIIMKAKGRPAAGLPEEPPATTASTEVLVIGADDPEGLLAAIEEVRRQIRSGRIHERNFAHFCFTNNTKGAQRPIRLALVAKDPQDLDKKLEQAPDAVRDPRKRIAFAMRGIYVGQGPRKGRLAMLFPGQGSQYVDMLRDMSTRFERVRSTLSEADGVMTPFIGKPITKYIFLDESNGVDRETAEESLRQTEICQPAVLAADLALFRLLEDHGVKPDLVAGHSLGEYGACVAAGVFSLKDALVAVSARGREMANIHVPDLGKMASVTADPELVAKHLEKIDGYVIPANKNCRVQTVIAGASDAVVEAVEMFRKEGIQAQLINVSAAFHSQIVAPAQEPFRRTLAQVDIRAPTTPILSNVHADFYPSGPDVKQQITELLSRQIASPVEWQKQMGRLYEEGARVFIEVGPKRTLTAFCGNILEGKEFFAAATNHPKKGGFYHFNDALALLAAWGYPVRFQDPTDPQVSTPAFRNLVERYEPEPATTPMPTTPNATPTGETDGVAETVRRLGINLDNILITGVGLGTPGRDKHIFAEDNIDRILEGRNHIDPVPTVAQQNMVGKNIVRLVKSATGDHRFQPIHDLNDVIRLMGQGGDFDLATDYGVPPETLDALDVSSALAIGAGIEALRDAGIPLVRSMVKTTTGKFLPGQWVLPVPLQEETGVVFASAFPGHNRLIDAVSRYFTEKTGGAGLDELAEVYADLINTVRDTQVRQKLTEWYTRNVGAVKAADVPTSRYEFSRKFLVQVLSMGHSQLAQLIKAKGPNTQVNSACSSTSVALAVAEDWIRMGRCKRVLVVGGDDVTNPTVADWFGSGFLAAGAATTKDKVEEAALPFDRRRHGMIMGMGAVGLVVEAESVVKERGQEGIVEIVASRIGNSAYHGTRLDTEHVAGLMDALMGDVERRLGVTRAKLAPNLLFMSHETYTPARGGSAAAEILALRKAFGPDANKIVVSNTKGFTGHPMGASIEDAIAIKSLQRGRVPPIANLREPDPELGDLNLSQGGAYDDLEYAIRLSAGFGSQIAFTFLKLRSKDIKRIVDAAKYEAWLRACSGQKAPELEVVNRTLRVKSTIDQATRLEPETPAAPEPSTPAPTPPTAPKPMPATAAAVSRDEVLARLLDTFAEKTGYPKDMLEPDLDLEADLGIDTVKQAELFGELRESYNLPRDESLQLKDIPTINAIVDYILQRSGDAAAPAPTLTPTPAATTDAATTSTATGASRGEVLDRLLDLFAEKTGYPKDMLEPDLDLEADLGIDTVKQAELFGDLRESYDLPRDESLQLKDIPTINAIVDYILNRTGTGDGASPTTTVAPTPEPTPAAPTPTPAAPTPPPVATPTAAADLDRSGVLDRLLDLFAEKTGYPKDMLEPDLDLEADLGIDTVKQAELFGDLRESYNLPRDESLQLKDIPTINAIVDYILRRADGSGATVPAPETAAASPPPVTPQPAQPEPAAQASTAAGKAPQDKAEAVEKIRALVAEKTGYPPDLLEEDLDLEADLGIDTVKQAEIFGDVRQLFGIPPVEGVQLSNYPTLGRVADFVVEHASGNGASAVAVTQPVGHTKTPTTTESRQPEAAADGTQRYVIRYVAVEGSDVAADSRHLEGQRLIVAGPTGTQALVDGVEARGGTAVILNDLPESWEQATDAVAKLHEEHGVFHGVLFATGTQPPRNGTVPADGRRMVRGLFLLLKALMAREGASDLRTWGVLTHMDGQFGLTGAQRIDIFDGALAGMAKAVARELPDVRTKVVDVPAGADAEAAAATLVEELARDDGLIEIGTVPARGTLKLLAEETVEESMGLDWGPTDVILVPGGGQGITGEILRAVAERTPTRFILLGRTELVDGVERLAGLDEAGLQTKKQEVTERLKATGQRVTPVMVEKEFSKITKSIEIHRTVAAIQAAGGDAVYVTGDVTKTADVANAVDLGAKLFGPVTGILHAAGVEESKLIGDKTPESFDRVFDVKVEGARALLAATEDQPVRSFITFASIAGRFGNAGQVDYSAANDALAKLSLALRHERGADFGAVTIDWSAWGEKGMATRGSVMTILKSLGVEPIPLASGVARFLRELAHGMHDPEVVVAGSLGAMAGDDLFTTADAVETTPTADPSSPSPVTGGEGGQQVLVVGDQGGQQETTAQDALLTRVAMVSKDRLEATLVLDADQEAYLDDHAIDGTPIFPGVFGVESFAEAAGRLAPGARFVGCRNVEFRLPLKLPRRRPVEAKLVAQVSDRGDDGTVEVGCRLESTFVNAKGQALGAPRIHFTGTLLLATDAPTAPEAATVPQAEETLAPKEIYEKFFHGPSFQVLGQLGFPQDPTMAVGAYSWPQKEAVAAGETAMVTAPRVRELAFQTAGGHELFKHGHLALPRRVGRGRFYGTAGPGEGVVAVATFKRVKDAVATYDVVVQTEDGRVLEVLEDYEMIRTDEAAAAEPAGGAATYRSRWGHDLPVPLSQARAVLVNDADIEEAGLKAEACLTEGERTDQERYRNDKRAREFFLGRLAAKEAVALILDRPVSEARGVEIRRLEGGQPEVQSAKGDDVLITISHQGPYAVSLAVRRDPQVKAVGIDFDRIEEKSSGFESESFTDGERHRLDAMVDEGRGRAELQVIFWTVKEAVLKALGKGFALDLHSVEIQRLDGDAVDVSLRGDAAACLSDLGATDVHVQSWTRDNYAYALAWLS